MHPTGSTDDGREAFLPVRILLVETEALERDGLIVVSRVGTLLDEPRSLSRDVARGQLVRLRRGVYVPSESWSSLNLREQHLLRVRAVIALAERPVIIAGTSAAAVWGMPVAHPWTSDVIVLDKWRGGGRAEPGVRRTAAGFESARTAIVDGITVTDLTRTTVDVVRKASFVDAVGSADWAQWRENPLSVSREALYEDASHLDKRLGVHRIHRVFGFSTHLAGSFGESEARAVIHLLGFAAPELQVEFRDFDGCMYPDFYWRAVNRAAEFDGKVKYTRQQYTGGRPEEVVWQEKKRTDRLQRQVKSVERILTEHVKNPRRLEALLLSAGIPRG